ncbi:hypothetical protein Tco_1300258 [Tanacetum coccineum]
MVDFCWVNEKIGKTLTDRMRMVYTGEEGQVSFTSHVWRMLFEIRGLLLGAARRGMTWREFILDLGLHTVEEIVEVPEKVTTTDLFFLRSMDQETTNIPYLLAQYLFSHAEGRKSRAKMSRGHFIGCLAEHFGLVSDEGLMGLSVIARVLSIMDLHELFKLNICVRLGDTWDWVASGLERQPIATAGTPEVAEGAPNVDEDAQAVPAPI